MSDPTEPDDPEDAVRAALDAQVQQENEGKPPPKVRLVNDNGPVWNPPTAPQMRPLNDAPIRVLGLREPDIFILTARGAFVEHPLDKITRPHLFAWFGGSDEGREILYRLFPKYGKPKKKTIDGQVREVSDVTDIDATAAQETLIVTGARQDWIPENHVRGRGAWRGTHGELIYNAGRALYVSDGTRPTERIIGQDVYPMDGAIVEPGDDARAGAKSAEDIFEIIQSWKWLRGWDARLMLGWVCGSAWNIDPVLG